MFTAERAGWYSHVFPHFLQTWFAEICVISRLLTYFGGLRWNITKSQIAGKASTILRCSLIAYLSMDKFFKHWNKKVKLSWTINLTLWHDSQHRALFLYHPLLLIMRIRSSWLITVGSVRNRNWWFFGFVISWPVLPYNIESDPVKALGATRSKICANYPMIINLNFN